MGISNENYTVSTTTKGDILVPIETEISYLNIKLLGYNAYGYHKAISQSLVNLADSIKALQDNHQTAIEYNVDLILQNAKDELDAKAQAINAGITTFIDDKMLSVTQTITDSNNENGESITTINTTLEGHTSTISEHTSKINEHGTILGSSDSGLINQANESDLKIATINETIGDKPIGDNAGSGILKDLYDIEMVVGSDTSGIIKSNKDNKTDITNIKLTLGDSSIGIISIVNDLNIKVNGNNSVRGIQDEVYDVSTGILARLVDVENYSTSISDLTSGTSTLKNRVDTITDTTIPDIVEDVENLESIVGLALTSGLQKKVKNLEDLNLNVLKDNVQNSDTGLLKVVGDSTSGLVKQVKLNKDKVAEHTTNLNTNNTKLDNLNLTVYGDDNNGIENKINNIDNTIKDYSTYTSGSTSVEYKASKLRQMDVALNEIETKNIVDQFRAYFYDDDNSAYIHADKFGTGMLQNWIDDTSTSGYNKLTTNIITDYFSNDNRINQIQTNKDAITLLNNTESINGSVRYLLKQSSDFLFNSTDGVITILNSGKTKTGSIRNTIDEQLTPIRSNIVSLNEHINQVEIQLNENTQNKQQIEEIQVEMVRYSTILPFMQKMFKLVNDSGSITNDELDTIFNDLQEGINTIENQEILNDCIFTYDGTNLSVTISLDKDQLFYNVNDFIGKISLISSGEEYSLYTDNTIDGQSYYSDTVLGNILQDVDRTADFNINDFTTEEIATLKIEYSTKDIFGQNKVYSKPVKII